VYNELRWKRTRKQGKKSWVAACVFENNIYILCCIRERERERERKTILCIERAFTQVGKARGRSLDPKKVVENPILLSQSAPCERNI
jgi:hypothetical protein